MKRMHYAAAFLIATAAVGCSKEFSLESGDVNAAKAQTLQQLIVRNKFQLRAFYSDVPIDYIDTDDTVKHETNLWPYVSNYLKDDFDTFNPNGSDVTISQNGMTMPGLPDPILARHYSITHDDNGVYMQFLNYQYNPLGYTLVQTGADYFILSVRWKNQATLYSRFEMVP